MNRILILLMLCILSGCATTGPQRQALCWSAMAADAVTTARIQHDPHVVEKGHIAKELLGPEPTSASTAAYFVGMGMLHYVIGLHLPEPWQERWQWACVVISTAYVINNCSVGLCD